MRGRGKKQSRARKLASDHRRRVDTDVDNASQEDRSEQQQSEDASGDGSDQHSAQTSSAASMTIQGCLDSLVRGCYKSVAAIYSGQQDRKALASVLSALTRQIDSDFDVIAEKTALLDAIRRSRAQLDSDREELASLRALCSLYESTVKQLLAAKQQSEESSKIHLEAHEYLQQLRAVVEVLRSDADPEPRRSSTVATLLPVAANVDFMLQELENHRNRASALPLLQQALQQHAAGSRPSSPE